MHVDLGSSDSIRDPARYFAAARERAGAVQWSDVHRAWVVLSHAEAEAGFRDVGRLSADRTEVFGRAAAKHSPAFGIVVELLSGWMNFRDDPAHQRLREPVRAAFTPRAVGALEQDVRDTVERTIAEFEGDTVELHEAFARPIKAFGPAVMDILGPMPYVASNMLLDGAFQKGARNYWKSHFLHDLSDGAIDALLDQYDRLPTPLSQIVIEHFHGAATRVPVADTAYALRDSGFNVLLVAQWTDPRDDDRCAEWCRSAYASLQPFISPRRYANYLSDDDLRDPVNLTSVYGSNLPRLRQVKKQFDPDNVFHLNLNIPPG